MHIRLGPELGIRLRRVDVPDVVVLTEQLSDLCVHMIIRTCRVVRRDRLLRFPADTCPKRSFEQHI